MNNTVVERMLNDTKEELRTIQAHLESLGIMSEYHPVFCNYAVIRACGTIEVAFKSIIYDVCEVGATLQLKNYLDKNIKESSMNPSFGNICDLLKRFDDDWRRDFKELVRSSDTEGLKEALNSLVDARNNFAHGMSASLSIESVVEYFCKSFAVMRILDSICIIVT